jgi:hypothetical protein
MSSWSSRNTTSAPELMATTSIRSSAPDTNGWRTVGGSGGYQAPVYSSLSASAAPTTNEYSPFGRQQSSGAAMPYSDNSPFGRKRFAQDGPGEVPSAFSSRRRTDQQDSIGNMPSAFSSGRRRDDNQENGGFSDRASAAFGERSGGSSALSDRASAAFGGKKDKENRGPSRREEEAAYQQEAFKRKLAELEAKKAAEIVNLEDEDAFPTLGAAPKPKKIAPVQPKAKAWHAPAPQPAPVPAPPAPVEPAPAPAAPKNTWATKLRDLHDETLIRQRQEAEAEEKRKENEVYIKLNTLNISENKPSKPINPYLSASYNQSRSTIMEEQDAFDYNNEFHRADDLLEPEDYAQPARVYSPHSPPYPYYSDNDQNMEDE